MTHRETILGVLREYKLQRGAYYGIEALGLFGSAARQQETEGSDVDVVVKTKTPDLFAIVHIRDELQERLDRPVDVVRLREKMNPYLRARIEQDAVYV